MQRSVWPCSLLILSFTLLTPIARSQGVTPDPGSVNGNVYTNNFFTMTWEFPKDWVVRAVPETPQHQDRNYSLVNLLPSGAQSADAVALVAEDFTDSPRFGYEYPDQLKALMKQQGFEIFGKETFYTLGGGVRAVRSDYKSKDTPPQYVSIIAGPLRSYEIKFVIQANSPERIDALVPAAVKIKISPDWTSASSASNKGNPPAMKVRVSENVSQALLERKVAPIYPDSARQTHTQGSVIMTAHINSLGNVEDLYVIEGKPILAKAALDAVSQWHHRPYLLNGQPVNLETQVTVNFQLR